MFETNTQNNSVLISLSRAAQLTGYHQDYLGQLCRLGKLPATKKGRVWFTSEDALNKLTSSPEPEMAISEVETSEADQFEYTEPEIVHNVTVSQVEGMPISIRTMPRNINNVQSILTTLRIEALQQEVQDLRSILTRLMAEVSKHADILQNKSFAKQMDLLKHSYIPSLDFNVSQQRTQTAQPEMDMPPLEVPSPQVAAKLGDGFLVWLSAAAVVAAIAVVGSSLLYGQFLGDSEAQVSTIYYHTNELAESPQTPLQPTVAGDTLPTVPAGDLR